MRSEKGRPLNNERLEFLGDAILDAIVGDIVYRHFEGRREGFLTNTRSKIVQRETSKQTGGRNRTGQTGEIFHPFFVAQQLYVRQCFRSFIGAIYLDQGYERCKQFMEEKILKNYIDLDKMSRKEVNFKSKLIEWSQKTKMEVSFELIEQFLDQDYNPMFHTEVRIEGLSAGTGTGYSKKESQQNAAQMALKKIKSDEAFKEAIETAKIQNHAAKENVATEETQIVAEETFAVETSEVPEATDYTEPADAAQDTAKSSETNPHTRPWTTKSWSSVTNLSFPAISPSGAEDISFPFSVTIRPNCPPAINSVACPPMRVDKLRSKGVGEPPRWIYPKTVSRVSIPVSYSISCAIYSAARFSAVRLNSFGNHNDGIRLSFLQTIQNRITYIMNIIRKFGNQNHITATSHTGVQRNPSGFMPHHFYYHHPLVRTGGGVQPVYGIRSNTDGRIKTERKIGPPNIIINGFRYGNYIQAHGSQLSSRLLRTVTADTDNTVQPQFLYIPFYQSRLVYIGYHPVFLERLLTGSTQHRTAQIQQTRTETCP